MDAFAEDLPPGSLLVRAGVTVSFYGCDYELMTVAVRKGRTAVLNGFADDEGRLEKEHITALKRALGPRGFNRLKWIRRKAGQKPRTITVPIQERYMSIDAAHQHAVTAVDNAIDRFTKDGDTDLAAAWTTVRANHQPPSAYDSCGSLHERYQALDPFVKAVSDAVALGLAHTDQSKPGHAAAKSALRAIHAVSVQVQNQIMAPIAAAPATGG